MHYMKFFAFSHFPCCSRNVDFRRWCTCNFIYNLRKSLYSRFFESIVEFNWLPFEFHYFKSSRSHYIKNWSHAFEKCLSKTLFALGHIPNSVQCRELLCLIIFPNPGFISSRARALWAKLRKDMQRALCWILVQF